MILTARCGRQIEVIRRNDGIHFLQMDSYLDRKYWQSSHIHTLFFKRVEMINLAEELEVLILQQRAHHLKINSHRKHKIALDKKTTYTTYVNRGVRMWFHIDFIGGRIFHRIVKNEQKKQILFTYNFLRGETLLYDVQEALRLLT